MDLWTEGDQHNTNMVLESYHFYLLDRIVSLLHAAAMISFYDIADIKTNKCARAIKLKLIEVRSLHKANRAGNVPNFQDVDSWMNLIWSDWRMFMHFFHKQNKTTGLQEDQINNQYYDMVWYDHWFLFISLPEPTKFICLRCGADVDTIADWLRIDQVGAWNMWPQPKTVVAEGARWFDFDAFPVATCCCRIRPSWSFLWTRMIIQGCLAYSHPVGKIGEDSGRGGSGHDKLSIGSIGD